MTFCAQTIESGTVVIWSTWWYDLIGDLGSSDLDLISFYVIRFVIWHNDLNFFVKWFVIPEYDLICDLPITAKQKSDTSTHQYTVLHWTDVNPLMHRWQQLCTISLKIKQKNSTAANIFQQRSAFGALSNVWTLVAHKWSFTLTTLGKWFTHDSVTKQLNVKSSIARTMHTNNDHGLAVLADVWMMAPQTETSCAPDDVAQAAFLAKRCNSIAKFSYCHCVSSVCNVSVLWQKDLG